MKVFLSYAAEDRQIAEEVQLALAGAGHEVFFDRESLPTATEYNNRIRAEIEDADAMVFLISPESVTPGKYTLSELKFARKKWPHPQGHVLPVRIRSVSWSAVPSYLKTDTVLQPEGNAAAEIVAALDELANEQSGGVFGLVRLSENEVLLKSDIASALESARTALDRLGQVTRFDPAHKSVEGTARYGLVKVKLRIFAVGAERGGTKLSIQASGEEITGVAAKSATRRFLDTLSNLQVEGYQPDRLGVHRMVPVAIIALFVLFLLYALVPPILELLRLLELLR